MRNFFIFGLPRSRTAWLANLFNTEKVKCYHLASVAGDIKKLFGKSKKEYVGMSEPNPHFYPAAKEAFPEAPIVVIQRGAVESFEAYAEKFSRQIDQELFNFFMQEQEWLDKIKEDSNAITFGYEDLDVEAIWQHLVPEVPFDKERADYLEEFNVQTMIQTDDDLKGYLGRIQ